MIEILQDMPAGVTGIRVSGRLLGDDLREIKPAMEDLLDTGEIRIVEVIASDYEGFGPGGLAEDLKLGFGVLFQHHSAFKRIAIVSDKESSSHGHCGKSHLRDDLRARSRGESLRHLGLSALQWPTDTGKTLEP